MQTKPPDQVYAELVAWNEGLLDCNPCPSTLSRAFAVVLEEREKLKVALEEIRVEGRKAALAEGPRAHLSHYFFTGFALGKCQAALESP